MFKVPEKDRIKNHPLLGSNSSCGNNGAFKIHLSFRSTAFAIASDGEGWEHVSVHIISDGKMRTPTWAEMCKIKNIFWDDDDTVIQFHPAKENYINNHPHTLHLWRPTDKELPTPDYWLIGVK